VFVKTAKKIEFVCENCGKKVKGDGYLNHCPHCLFSKHVDINPGDRAEKCHGLMAPIGAEIKRGEKRIIHQCLKCDKRSVCKTEENDNFEVFLRLLSLFTEPV